MNKGQREWDNTYGSNKEVDPDGKEPHEPGSKLDYGKPSVYTHFMRYFPRAILAVTDVSEFGARKYTTDGWVTVEDGVLRYSDALCRHLIGEAKGEVWDKDSELLHAAQTCWNGLARLELMLRHEEEDSETTN